MHRGPLARRVEALERQYGDGQKPSLIAVYRDPDGNLSEEEQARLQSAQPWDYVIEYEVWREDAADEARL